MGTTGRGDSIRIREQAHKAGERTWGSRARGAARGSFRGAHQHPLSGPAGNGWMNHRSPAVNPGRLRGCAGWCEGGANPARPVPQVRWTETRGADRWESHCLPQRRQGGSCRNNSTNRREKRLYGGAEWAVRRTGRNPGPFRGRRRVDTSIVIAAAVLRASRSGGRVAGEMTEQWPTGSVAAGPSAVPTKDRICMAGEWPESRGCPRNGRRGLWSFLGRAVPTPRRDRRS